MPDERQAAGVRRETGHDEPIVIDNGPIRINMGGRMGHPVAAVGTNPKKWQRRHSGFGSMIHLAFDDNGKLLRVDNRQLKGRIKAINIHLVGQANPLVFRFAVVADPDEKPGHLVLEGDLSWQLVGDWLTTAGSHSIERVAMINPNGKEIGVPFSLAEKKRTIVIDGDPE